MPRESCFVLKQPVVGTDFTSYRWLSLDGCGFFCVFVGQILHVYIFSVVQQQLLAADMWISSFDESTSSYSINENPRLAFRVISVVLTSLSLACHWRAMLTDPGAVPASARPLPGKSASNRCNKCTENPRGAFKPPRAHHDSITGRCVVKMDHFCVSPSHPSRYTLTHQNANPKTLRPSLPHPNPSRSLRFARLRCARLRSPFSPG